MSDQFQIVEGRTVLLKIAEGEYRPATIVKTFGAQSPCANLVVFLDGSNDTRFELHLAGVTREHHGSCVGWATSRVHGDGVGEWITPPELVALRADAWRWRRSPHASTSTAST